MDLDRVRDYCLSLPHAAEKIQWENDLLFTIGGKIFAVTPLEPAPFVLTFKPTPERRVELLEIEGVEPAPYLARAGWVSVRRWDVFRDAQWRELIAESYQMILAKLPKKVQGTIAASAGATTGQRAKKSTARAKTKPSIKQPAKVKTRTRH